MPHHDCRFILVVVPPVVPTNKAPFTAHKKDIVEGHRRFHTTGQHFGWGVCFGALRWPPRDWEDAASALRPSASNRQTLLVRPALQPTGRVLCDLRESPAPTLIDKSATTPSAGSAATDAESQQACTTRRSARSSARAGWRRTLCTGWPALWSLGANQTRLHRYAVLFVLVVVGFISA